MTIIKVFTSNFITLKLSQPSQLFLHMKSRNKINWLLVNQCNIMIAVIKLRGSFQNMH